MKKYSKNAVQQSRNYQDEQREGKIPDHSQAPNTLLSALLNTSLMVCGRTRTPLVQISRELFKNTKGGKYSEGE
jgi:hypothetical protein